jgi:hypothetical protein
MNTRSLRAILALLCLSASRVTGADLRLTVQSLGATTELSWASETGFDYRVEATGNLANPSWESVASNLAGTGSPLRATDPATSTGIRFYRVIRTERSGPQISPQAVEPASGDVYPAGTILGSALLGRQFTVPAQWKAGLRTGASSLLLVSDTEPGLILSFTSLAGNADHVAAQLGQGFYVGQFGGFTTVGTPSVNGSRLHVEWRGVGFSDEGENLEGLALRAEARLHPSGGVVAFVGLFTEPNRATMERVLGELLATTVTVPRNTRTDLVGALAGKSFTWVKAAQAGNGGGSGSLQRWTEKNAFLCAGTYEITTQSESSFSGNVSGGGFYTGYSNSSSTEAGDWTIVETATGPVMVMISGTGGAAAFLQVSGNSVIFGDQQFDYRAPHACP